MASRKRVIAAWERRRDVAKLHCSGLKQHEIADRLGITQGMVSKDLQAIEKEWRAEASGELQRHKAIQLARIDEVERGYWEEWERSRGVTRVKTIKGLKDNGGAEDKSQFEIKQIEKTKDLVRNPDFMKGVLSCIEARNKLLGLYQIAGTEDRPLIVKMVGEGMLAEV